MKRWAGGTPAAVKAQTAQHGFTLVELSLVLVIIGLIIGGVFAGRELIRTSELRKVISEVDGFRTALNSFRIKYNGVPGDLPTATKFFTGVLDGDGNGKVEEFSPVMPWVLEYYSVWSSLSQAGLITGTYQFGECQAGNNYGADGTVQPLSVIKPNLYYFWYDELTSMSGNFIQMTSRLDGHPWCNDQAQLRCRDLKLLDDKMDDGEPIKGKMIVENACFTGAGDAARYAVLDDNWFAYVFWRVF